MGQSLATITALPAIMDSQSQAKEAEVSAAASLLNIMLENKITEGLAELHRDDNLTAKSAGVIATKVYKRFNVSDIASPFFNQALDEVLGGNYMETGRVILTGILDTFLGNATVGATQKTRTQQMWVENAMIDFRIFMFRYKSSWKGLNEHIEDGLVVIVVKHVLDLSCPKATELIMNGLNGQLKQAEDELEQIVSRCDQARLQLQNGASEKTIQHWLAFFPGVNDLPGVQGYQEKKKDEEVKNDDSSGTEKKDDRPAKKKVSELSYDALTALLPTFREYISSIRDEKSNLLQEIIGKKDTAFKNETEKLQKLYAGIMEMKKTVEEKRKDLIKNEL